MLPYIRNRVIDLADITKTRYQIIFLVAFETLFGFTLSSGVMTSLFVLRILHASPTQFSLIVSLGAITGLLVDLPTSALADKYSRKLILSISILFGLAGQIIAALSQNYIIFLIASMFLSVRMALRGGVIEAMLYDNIHIGGYKDNRYHYIMSRFGILALVGSITSTFLGGLVANQFGVRTIFWLDIITMTLLLLGLIFIHEPSRHYTQSKLRLDKHLIEAARIVFRSKNLTYFFVFNLLLWTYATIFNSFNGLYFTNLGYGSAILGTFGAINALAVLGGHAVFRNHEKTPGWLVYALTIFLFLSMAWHQPLISTALFFVQAFFIGALTAVFDREKQLVLPDHMRSTMLSGFGLSTQLLFLPLSFIFGALTNVSVATAFMVAGGSVLILLSFMAARRKYY